MRPAIAVLALAVGAASITCGGGSGPSSAQQIPLSQCLPGWWLGLPLSQSPCLSCKGKPAPECTFSDCAEWDATGFKASGEYFGGTGTYSAKAGTMSGFLSSTAAYVITDGGYQIVETGNRTVPPVEVTSCTQSQRMDGLTIETRAPTNLATAFDQASADGGVTFTSFPVAQ
jgi:hypothetical protein